MEKLILFLIVFGIGSFFEFLKQKKGQRTTKSVSQNRPPAAGRQLYNTPAPQRPKQEIQKPVTIPTHRGNHEKPISFNPQPHRPVVLPEEGESIFKNNEDSKPEATAFSPQSQDRELSEHYEHWRRAIIDAEILQRKF